MSPKVSIVVPVYNTEKYLEECLESLVNQSLVDIEIITVNDGSTDTSLQILESYADKDDRIVIIDKDNSGCASSKNTAIKVAKGDCLMIVDSDDWIELETCEVMYNLSTSHDLDMIQLKSFSKFSDEIPSHSVSAYVSESAHTILSGREFSYTRYTPSFTCGKMWKREFLLSNRLRYYDEINCADDQLITFEGILLAERMLVIDYPAYHYRIHSDSMTGAKRLPAHVEAHYFVARGMLVFIKCNDLWDYYGFMKRLLVILNRLKRYNTESVGVTDAYRLEVNRFIRKTIRECRSNRSKGIKFRSHIERFYLLPSYGWKYFKLK